MALDIIIYSTMMCPFCVRAKQLLDSKGVVYQEIRIDEDMAKREEMLEKSGGRKTVPQIFINGNHVGGFDDLRVLNEQGELDKIISSSKS